MKPKVAVIITRSEIGGAQNYVLSVITRLSTTYEFDLIVGSEGYLSKAARGVGANVYLVSKLDSSNLIAACYRLRKILQQRKHALINTHSTLASIYTRLASVGLKTPVIYSVHGWFFAENATPARKLFGPSIERVLTRFTNYWITETRYDQKIGIDRGIIPSLENSCVIPNGIPKPDPKPALKLDPELIQLVFVGRNSYQKNPCLAIRVISELPQNFVLTMYCDNADDKQIVSLMKKHGLNDRIQLFDNENNTASIIHSYDLLLATSRFEGMPLSIIEAMSAGLPIVCSDVCGLAELVEDGVNGYLIASQNPVDFANGVLSVFSDSKHAAQMGKCSQSLYRERHTLDKMTGSISSVFTSMISTNH